MIARHPGMILAVVVLFLVAQVAAPWPAANAMPADDAWSAQDSVVVRLDAAVYVAARQAGISPVSEVDYGAFAWLALAPGDVARLEASGLEYEVVPEPFTLHLGGVSFDPLHEAVRYPTGWGPVAEDGPGLQLIQFVGPIRDEWLARVGAGEFEIVQYIHPFTYVVWGEPAALAQWAQRDAAVRWGGAFAPAYRVLPQWRALPAEPVPVDVLIYRGAGEEETLRALDRLGATQPTYAPLNATLGLATLTLSGTVFREAAGIPGVYSIQPEPVDGGLRGEMSSQVNVNNLDGSGYAVPGYQAWLSGVGLSGVGVRIANVDGGVYNSHPDLVNRLVPCTGTTCGGSASDGHGTHTAGIMAADGASGTVDPQGFLRGLGVAPGANLVEQLYYPYYTYPDGMLLLIKESYRNNASLSGNSWGPSGSPVGYDNDTMQVDIGVRDADPDVVGNQAFNYILSIMNGNGGTSTQGSPDEAKNIFTIGSTKMQNSDGSQILAINDISANSAHGPCLDGRKIPHLVAPGCRVDSTTWPSSYATMCGTSMASPQVSGAVALFIEYYRGLMGVDPSPALVKAAFLPVAHDLAGHLDADGGILGHPFDSKQGWGRLDVAAVLDPQVSVRYDDNPYVFDATGEVWVQTLTAVDPAHPVRLMLVWTDAPGHGLGGSTPAWNNDLDLLVVAGGATYRGNYFGSDGWSTPGGTADGKNNTEGVLLPAGLAGTFEVQVVASNIDSDGIPGQGDLTDQDFALVCYNCNSEGDFGVALSPAAVDICLPGTVTTTVDVTEIPPFQEVVTLTAAPLPGLSAWFAPAQVTPPGQSTLTLTASGTPTGSHRVVISGTTLSAVHTATLSLFVSDALPGVPLPTLPPDGAAGLPPSGVTLGWDPTGGGFSYNLEVATDPTFGAPLVKVSGVTDVTYTLPALPDAPACYFWWVAAGNACGTGTWSAWSRFGTGAPGATPVMTAIAPAFVPAGESVTVTLTGENLAAGAVVVLGDVPLPDVTWISSRTVTALVPGTFEIGVYDVTLYNPDCQVATLAGAFEVGIRPDLALSVTPQAFDVCLPAVVTAVVSVAQVSPEPPLVTLAVAVPEGVSAELNPVSVTPPATATLTLSVMGAPTGTHQIVISGTATWAVHTATLSLSVSDGAPGVPLPMLPSDGAAGQSPLGVMLGWDPVGGAAGYSLEVATEPAFGAPLVQVGNVMGVTYTLPALPEAPACYFWRVAGENVCGMGAWSAGWRFGTGLLGQRPGVTGVEPAFGFVGQAVTVTLDGKNLASGLVVLVGDTPLVDVTWIDPVTVLAVVPGTLSAGTYGLTLYNPDCWMATLADAFEVRLPEPVQWSIYLPLVQK